MSSRKDELLAMIDGLNETDKRFLFAEIAKGLVEKNGPMTIVPIQGGAGTKIGYFVPPLAWVEFPLKEDVPAFEADLKQAAEGPVSDPFEVLAEFQARAKNTGKISFNQLPPDLPKAG